MKVYEAVYESAKTEGVYGISLVENPAMEDLWIALSEQKEQVKFSAIDEKKRLLLGAVLIPNKKIYRNIDGNEFYITFSEDTIGGLAHDFIKNGHQNNSSAEHEVKLSDVSFVESWQVEDPSIDKSALYGKNYEKGTWVTMAKVSPEIYEQATNGTFKGFSIDALLGLQELNFKTEVNMSEKVDTKSLASEIMDGLKTMLNLDTKEEVKAEVQEEVKLEETKEPVEAAPTEVEVVAEVVETVSQEPSEIDKLKEEVAEILAQFKSLKEDATKQVESKDKEIEELKAELSKQPEAEPIKAGSKVQKEVITSSAASIKERVQENLSNFWD